MEKNVKNKIEIVIDPEHLEPVLNVLKEEDLLGYTSVKKKKEENFQTEIPLNFKNDHLNVNFISVKCSDTKRSRIVSRLFPLITQLGGFCIAYSELMR